VEAIHFARERVRRALAESLQAELQATYERLNVVEDYEASAEQIARRSLKNAALSYLALLPGEENLARCAEQYRIANNMTDRLAALTAMVNSDAPDADAVAGGCLEDFLDRFEHEALAVDLWLSVQAGSRKPDALDKVKDLLKHPSFHITNPNKVRALIGTFCNQNLINFHREDGAGYAFLGEQICQLNSINPQIASRLLTPLTRWRKYDGTRQELMKAELQKLQQMGNLSKDVYEVVEKSLAS